MMSYIKIVAALFALIAIGALVAVGTVRKSINVSGTSVGSVPAITPERKPTSTELYKTNCAKCHQDSGKGGETVVDGKKIDAEDLTSDRMKRRDDDRLADDIAEGSPDDGMPAFRDKLSNSQINEIVKYIRVNLQHVATNTNSK